MKYAADDMSIHAVVSRLTTGTPLESWVERPPQRGRPKGSTYDTTLKAIAERLARRNVDGVRGAQVAEVCAEFARLNGRACTAAAAYRAMIRLKPENTYVRDPVTMRWIKRYYL